MTISLAIVVGVFMLADKWKYLHKKHLPIFGAMGQNALIFYVVGGIFSQLAWIVLGLIGIGRNNYLPGGWAWYYSVNAGHLFLSLAIMMIPLFIMAYLFQRYKVRLSF